MKSRSWGLFLSVAVCAGAAGVGRASTISVPLGATGWQIAFDSRIKSQVGIHLMGLRSNPNTIVLELDKWFVGEKPDTGFDPIDLTFVKTDVNTTYNRFVIKDEFIANNTDSDWLDFHMFLSPGVVGFDNTSSAYIPDGDKLSGVDFSNPTGYNDLPVELNFRAAAGQNVPHDAPSNYFQPGQWGGDIVILANPYMGKVDPKTNLLVPSSFLLKEFPTPEPASLLLLSGLVAVGFRKRR